MRHSVYSTPQVREGKPGLWWSNNGIPASPRLLSVQGRALSLHQNNHHSSSAGNHDERFLSIPCDAHIVPMATRVFFRALPNLTQNASRLNRRCARSNRSHGMARCVATYTSPYQAAQISVLQSAVDANSASYAENTRNMNELVQKLTTLHKEASLGGSAKAREKHISRGKMLVRE